MDPISNHLIGNVCHVAAAAAAAAARAPCLVVLVCAIVSVLPRSLSGLVFWLHP